MAHSDHEALTEDQLTGAVDGYEKLILHALGKKSTEGQFYKESL